MMKQKGQTDENIEKLIENGGWRLIEGLPKDGSYFLAKTIASQQIVIVCWDDERDAYLTEQLGWYGKETLSHFMPLNTPETMARVIREYDDGLQTIIKHFPETEVLVKKVREKANRIAGGGDDCGTD